MKTLGTLTGKIRTMPFIDILLHVNKLILSFGF